MPLSKEKMRELQRQRRDAVKPMSNLNEIIINKDKAIKLMTTAHALDRPVLGLGGQKDNMLDLIQYGGMSMRVVKGVLEQAT